MQTIFNKTIFGVFFLVFLSFSCSSNLDFNQKIGPLNRFFEVKDIFKSEVYRTNSPIPVINGSSFPLTIPPVDFNITAILNDNDVIKNLKKVVFYVTIINTINQTSTINLDFRDSANNSVKKSVFNIPSAASVNKEIVFEESELSILKSITNIQFTGFITIVNTPISIGSVNVNSNATVYLK